MRITSFWTHLKLQIFKDEASGVGPSPVSSLRILYRLRFGNTLISIRRFILLSRQGVFLIESTKGKPAKPRLPREI